MKTRTWLIAVLAMLAISFLIGIVSYSQLPAQAVTHWNAQGQPDGYSSRFSAAFLMPILLVFVVGLMLLLPRIDPMRFNAAGFREPYYFFVVLIVAFMLYLQALTILYNFGVHFDMVQAMIPGYVLLDFATAYLLRRAKPNWFIGIRTPWTLSNEQVWTETHRVGSLGFAIAGALSLFGLVFPSQAFLFIIVPLLIVAVYTVAYSYFSYRRIA
jgi:uncharacterized membrane protein